MFTQGKWAYMSGMVDAILKCSEDGQTQMRLLGPKMHDYTMSTCYFLGQRPELALEIQTLSSGSASHQSPLAPAHSFVTSDGTRVSAYVLVPESSDQRSAAGVKRTFDQMEHAEDGGAAMQGGNAGGSEDTWRQETGATRLVLCYSPYHRAKSRLNTKRRNNIAASPTQALDLATSVCYSVVLPSLPGKFDVKKAEELGVPNGRLRGMLVKGQTVMLEDGREVRPEECVSTSVPGGTILIIDCPTRAHAASLARTGLFGELVAQEGKAGPLCVVHMSPREVLSCADYETWCKPFPPSSPVVVPGAAAPSGGSNPVKAGKASKGGGAQNDAAAAAKVVHLVCCPDTASVERPLFVASERYLRLLHGLDGSFFPLSQGAYKVLLHEPPGLYCTNISAAPAAPPPDSASCTQPSDARKPANNKLATAGSVVIAGGAVADGSAPSKLNGFGAWPLMTFVLPPHKQPGLKCEVPDTARLHYYCLKGCVCTESSRAALYDSAAPHAAPHAQVQPQASASEPVQGEGVGQGGGLVLSDAVFLGTGAASPFKYRTVSAIYLGLAHNASEATGGEQRGEQRGGGAEQRGGGAELRPGVVLDAGDGTYGAMVRKMGVDAADAAVLGLKMLFISHKHADHISGAANILTRRAHLLRQRRHAAHSHLAPPQAAAAPGAAAGIEHQQQHQPGAAIEAVECSVCGQRFGSESSVEVHQRAAHPRIMRPPTRVVEDGVGGMGGQDDDERLLVVGPMWLDSWLRDLGALEPLSYRFIDCQDLTSTSKSGGALAARLHAQLGMRVTCVQVQHSFPAYGIVLHFAGTSLAPNIEYKVVYSGDTRPCLDLALAGADADLLIHEATHSDDMIDKARSDRLPCPALHCPCPS